MYKILKHRVKKIGLSPGSLIHFGDITDTKIRISIIDYDNTIFIEKHNISLEECLNYKARGKVLWININGIQNIHLIQSIGTHFKLHPLMLEDVMSAAQRSKLDDYKDYLYIVMRLLYFQAENEEVNDEQISIVLGKNFVITFLETEKDLFEPIRERIRKPNTRIRQREADYLCYSILDTIVDNYFIILEKVDGVLEKLENELLTTPETKTLQKIQKIKRQLILLRKSVWPTRDVISQFLRNDTTLIHETTRLYTHDVYDHTIQAIDTIEGFRDISSGMLDIYMSSISLRMNEIMKVLTIVATIFVPLTFVASLYGMNFDIPELHVKGGYYYVLALMALMAIGMIVYFKRKKWI